MNNVIDLQSAIATVDEYGHEKKQTNDLSQSRNKQQMTKYIVSLDYNLRRLLILQETVNEIVENKKRSLILHEEIKTYTSKVINLSHQFNISYDEVIQIMVSQEEQSKLA